MTYVVLVVCTLLILQKPAPYPATPTAVVEAYLREDAGGAGMSSRTIDRIFQYTTWTNGPGCDHGVIIEGYEARLQRNTDKSAIVLVSYRVLGDDDSTSFAPKRRNEQASYEVRRVGHAWKIEAPILCPHVLAASRIAFLRRTLGDEVDKRPTLRKLVADLERAGKTK
jgi:hypothetical protein